MMKVSQAMFNESKFEYEIAILGNDLVALEFAKQACNEFARVVLIEEVATKSFDCIVGLTRLVGKAWLESENEIVCETENGSISISASQIIIATGDQLVRPRWMLDLPNVVFAGEKQEVFDRSDVVAIAKQNSVEIVSHNQCVALDACVIGLQEEAQSQIRVFLEDGTSTLVDAVVVSEAERCGQTSLLNLRAAGLSADDRGCIWCNENYETWTSNIYAIGNVVGYPGTENSIKEQIDLVMNSILNSQRVLSCL